MKKFIRDINTAPEPAIVLADDQQIVDLLRFCTSSFEFGILTVDPTFSLGEFDVTPITYRHLLLETRRNNQPPVFLGPLLVHYRKTFSSYLFFTSSLIGLNRGLGLLVRMESNHSLMHSCTSLGVLSISLVSQ
jgi:hypothetical protein